MGITGDAVMKYIQRLLIVVIALVVCGTLGYVVSSVFGLLRWFVFIIVFLFLGEIFYRLDKWIW